MRVLKRKSDGRIIESQPGNEADYLDEAKRRIEVKGYKGEKSTSKLAAAILKQQMDVLIKNAEAAGLSPKEVEVIIVPDEEFHSALTAQIEGDKTYGQKRIAEYPSVGEMLDDLYHAGAFSETMTARIRAVKAKFPKK